MTAAPPVTAPARVHSLGCRLNIAEGARIEALLASRGDIVVVNSCGVTANAVRSSRSAVRQAVRDHPDARVVVTGCASQIDPASFAAIAGVSHVVGNGDKFDADAYCPTAGRPAGISDIMQVARTAPQLIPAMDGHTRLFLDVQNGCDHRCTFCIIPYGRGPSRSVPVEQVVATAKAALAQSPRREIVLTGVDLTSYGADLAERPTLAMLCRGLLDALPDLDRLRLGSIDVAEIDGPLFDLLTREERMLPHVHLSLQAGDDLILKRMKRRHSRADAVAMAGRLKMARPDIAIGADLIAGFPTESDEAAARTRALIRDCDIVFAHIFPFSPRIGTPAARMPQLPPGTARQRADALRHVAATHRQSWLGGLIGSRQRVLVERDGRTGHAGNFARVALDAAEQPGTIVEARINGLDGETLLGKRAA
mgnify:CR=1 FL=1